MNCELQELRTVKITVQTYTEMVGQHLHLHILAFIPLDFHSGMISASYRIIQEMDEPGSQVGLFSPNHGYTALLQLIASSVLFGISFVYQRYAMIRGIGPITFNACRFPISTVLTIIAQILLHQRKSPSFLSTIARTYTSRTWKWGIFCGIFVFGGSVLQQVGLYYVEAAKMSFITGTFVIFVPMVEWCVPGFGSGLNSSIWISAAVSIIGMLLLSGFLGTDKSFPNEESVIGGEVIVFVSMLLWVVVLMATDVAAKVVDCISLAVVEDLVCSLLTLFAAFSLEPQMMSYPYESIIRSWDLILIVAVVEGSAVVLGILGQVYVSPSVTALISSSASVYTAIGGYLFLGEILRPLEMLGCVLILAATVYAARQVRVEEMKAPYVSIPT